MADIVSQFFLSESVSCLLDMHEKRSEFRFKTNRSGKLFLDGGDVIDCLVHDLSANGAGLEVTDPKQIPDEFVIKISGMDRKYRCRITWKNEGVIGVQFREQVKAGAGHK
jgi:hypothetical protein